MRGEAQGAPRPCRRNHLCQEALRLFMAPDNKSLGMSGCDQPALPLQIREHHDGVIPSGASVLIACLKTLGNLQPEHKWHYQSTQLEMHQLTAAAHAPVNHLWLLRALTRIS